MATLHIAYQTFDEVNLQSATQAARECGATLIRLQGMSLRSAGPFDAMMHDLDHMDDRFVGEIVTGLLSGPAPLPAAVHGYNLGDEEMTALHANGVVATRQFNPQLVRALCRAVGRAPTAACEPSQRGSPEASDDPGVLCEMVRSLATHAHRALPRGPAESPDDLPREIAELREHLRQFQQHLDRFRRQHNLGFEDLQRWLDSLRRRVDGVVTTFQPGDELPRDIAESNGLGISRAGKGT